MNFIADKQTLTDLNVMGKYNASSLFSLFNTVVTRGGEQLLDDMFRHPLTNHEAINERAHQFQYFTGKAWTLPIDQEQFNLAGQYLLSGGEGITYPVYLLQAIKRSILNKMGVKQEYDTISNGFTATILVLQQLIPFLRQLQKDPNCPFENELQQWLEEPGIQPLLQKITGWNNEKMNFLQFVSLDHSFRSSRHKQFLQLLDMVYRLDLAIAVGNVAREKGMVYPLALPREASLLEIINCRHPTLPAAIGNDCRFDLKQNLLFLTGANMAGKSTYMKSIGCSFYLAHMGFPVAAGSMVFSVKEGLFTSINVADNLNQGISHFYAEVLRVKQVAETVCARHNLLIIFDELFKGTNVKDAFDATLEVTKSFARFRNCNFIISTHIIEVGDALKKDCRNITYGFMPTVMKGNMPTYPYTMQQGITSDRQGMMIIDNEGILEMLAT